MKPILALVGVASLVAALVWARSTRRLHVVWKRVEAERGRDFDAPRHSPRPVDLDLLLLGDLELRSHRLTLPHRELTARRFVLAPLLELDPELTLPDGTRLADALDALGDDERVDRVGSLG